MSTCGSCGKTMQFGRRCCGSAVQTPPSPCCEAHKILYQTSDCYHVTCGVTATVESPFYMTFAGACDQVPMNASEVFFYHQVAGWIIIQAFDGISYKVILRDATRVGAYIDPEDCILVTTILPDSQSGGSGSSRCLSGNFAAPAEGADPVQIYILNGSGIPIGANLTFTWEGETGTYVVTGFVTSTGNVYVYNVQNTGSGLTPGTIVEAGTDGSCSVPIEIITDVEICNLSASQVLDTIVGCFQGSPRAGTATGPDQAWVSGPTAPYPFELRVISNTDCCVELDGVLKFTAAEGCEVIDTVHLRDINLDCFEPAVLAAFAANNNMPVVINGLPFVVTAWDSGANNATFSPIGDVYDGNPFISFAAGTRVCLGDCCNSCIDGPQSTNPNFVGEDPEYASGVAISDPGPVGYDATDPLHYLIGFDTAGAPAILLVDSTYNTLPPQPLPKHADPLLLRQKICNTSPNGCDQIVDFGYNYQLLTTGLPALMRCSWEFGHFLSESATLADNVTPNTFSYAASASKDAGYIDGPTVADTTVTPNTGLGYGDASTGKHFPYVSGSFIDFSRLKKCDCLNTILYLALRLEPLPGYAGAAGDVSVYVAVRRMIRKYDYNEIAYPQNNPTGEGWA